MKLGAKKILGATVAYQADAVSPLEQPSSDRNLDSGETTLRLRSLLLIQHTRLLDWKEEESHNGIIRVDRNQKNRDGAIH